MGYPFYRDPDRNFRVEVALGGVPHGLGDVGEILTAVQQAPDGADEAWATAFSSLADRIAAVARSGAAAGRRRTARDAFLRAATYYSYVLEAQQFFADDQTIRATFRSHRACWDAFAGLNEPAWEPLDLPYEDTTMPGYFLPAAGAGRHPTVVFINGSDGALTWLWPEAQAAHQRGANALVFDGPGQQSMLFERGIPFRPDWEAVVGPVVDTLVARPEVDPDALVLWGGSQGGYWAPRVLAFEHRFAAGVCDPGVVDVATSWLSHLPAELVHLLDAGDAKDFDAAMAPALASPQLRGTWSFRARPYGYDSPFRTLTAMREYTVADVAGKITTPLFVCDPEGEQFWPGQSERLAALAGGPTELVAFTAAEGADGHCEPMARSLVQQRMYDWLGTVVPGWRA